MTEYKDDKPGIWLNIYVLFTLVWSDRMMNSDPSTFMWWFYTMAFAWSALASVVMFVGVVAAWRRLTR